MKMQTRDPSIQTPASTPVRHWLPPPKDCLGVPARHALPKQQTTRFFLCNGSKVRFLSAAGDVTLYNRCLKAFHLEVDEISFYSKVHCGLIDVWKPFTERLKKSAFTQKVHCRPKWKVLTQSREYFIYPITGNYSVISHVKAVTNEQPEINHHNV